MGRPKKYFWTNNLLYESKTIPQGGRYEQASLSFSTFSPNEIPEPG